MSQKPISSKVKVYESKNSYYAAISYSGYTNYSKEKILVYNSPYKFFNRKNEILIPINYNLK